LIFKVRSELGQNKKLRAEELTLEDDQL